MEKIEFGILGSGWRAAFYLRIAKALPEKFAVTGIVSRSEEKRKKLQAQWAVKTFSTLEDMINHTQPDFVVTSVPWEVNPVIIERAVNLNIPVLSETPPAPDIKGLIKLYQLVENGAKIQVAEQYHLQPLHVARIAAVKSGFLGEVSHVQVSVAHGYHGISLIRHLLGLSFQKAKIIGVRQTSSIMAGPDRYGLPSKKSMKDSVQDICWINFGDKSALFDFTEDQYFSWIRGRRVLIRGDRGEIINKEITYLKDYLTPISLSFKRYETGVEGNLEGNYLKGIQLGHEWLYRNPFIPASLSDDEIAIASCLVKMDDYLKTAKDFYSLAEACQDHYLSLMCEQAIKSGEKIETKLMPWAV